MTANLSQSQKEYFQELAETSLNDLGTLHQWTSEEKNEYADTSQTFTDIEEIPCGLSYASVPNQRENIPPVILQADAILRVKLSQELSVKDDFTIRNKRYHIDNIWDGLTIRFAALKHLETSENG